ncbi:hypothetical protein AB0C71_39640 [Streptomyces anulatus]|uniref:hypothetical protein n=1 Tax=Streptomyces anulatus TaxID=1892 RepID=UPI0033EF3E53
MTSVRETSATAPPRTDAPRGPKCNGPGCGQALVHIPGKKPKVYCSPACKMRAKRAIERNAKTTTVDAGQTSPAPKSNAGICSKGKSPSTAGQSAAAEASAPKNGQSKADPRDARFERRDRHQTVALGRAFLACGTKLTGKTAEVLWKPGEATIGGTCRCNNVHVCAWCMSRILAVRSANIQAAADGLAAAGYGLHLGTNTLRHFPRNKFGTVRKGMRHGLVAVLTDGWKGAYGSAGRRWRTLRDDFGIVGYERAFEDTFGWDTGWHLHWHTMWVTKEVLDTDTQAAFRDALAGAWASGVEAAGGYSVSESCERPDCHCGGKGHGFDLRPLNKGEEGQAARYLYKDGDKAKGGGVAKIGLELASDNKAARLDGRMGPLDLGDAAAAELLRLGQPGPLVEKYREREFGVFQVRKHYRTQNLNKLIKELGIAQDTRTENEITDDTVGLTAIAVIPAGTWYRHIARHKGRRLDLVKVAETYGLPGVRRLVESWGLVWGKDVLDPPPVLGPADLDAEQLALEEPREIPPAEAKFRAARKAANEARAKEVAAALDRFRNPRREVQIKVSLKKPIRAKNRSAA